MCKLQTLRQIYNSSTFWFWEVLSQFTNGIQNYHKQLLSALSKWKTFPSTTSTSIRFLLAPRTVKKTQSMTGIRYSFNRRRHTSLTNLKSNFEEFSALFHDGYFSRHGCNIPFYGGLRISNDNRRHLCINTTLYSRDMVDDMMRAVIQEMRIPCKKSEIYFGVPIVEVAENELIEIVG